MVQTHSPRVSGGDAAVQMHSPGGGGGGAAAEAKVAMAPARGLSLRLQRRSSPDLALSLGAGRGGLWPPSATMASGDGGPERANAGFAQQKKSRSKKE